MVSVSTVSGYVLQYLEENNYYFLSTFIRICLCFFFHIWYIIYKLVSFMMKRIKKLSLIKLKANYFNVSSVVAKKSSSIPGKMFQCFNYYFE